MTLPSGDRAGFTFAPVQVSIPGLPPELKYYHPAWVADSGVAYTLASVQALLVAGGDAFYDQASGEPYNPASPFFQGTAYTLTAPDGTQNLIAGTGKMLFQKTEKRESKEWKPKGEINTLRLERSKDTCGITLNDEKIDPVPIVDSQRLVAERDHHLSAHRQVSPFQFIKQTGLISAF